MTSKRAAITDKCECSYSLRSFEINCNVKPLGRKQG